MLTLTVRYQFSYSWPPSGGRHEDSPRPLEICSNWRKGGNRRGGGAFCGSSLTWPDRKGGVGGGGSAKTHVIPAHCGPWTLFLILLCLIFAPFLRCRTRRWLIKDPLSQHRTQHDWLDLQSINSDKHLPRSPFTHQFFCFGVYIVN
jgi:hypothetical protein